MKKKFKDKKDKNKLIKNLILLPLSILIFVRFLKDGITYPFFNMGFSIFLFLLFIIYIFFIEFKIVLSFEEIFLFLYLIFSILSNIFSEIKGTGIRYNTYISNYFCLFFLLKRVAIINDFKNFLFFSLFLSIFFVSIYGIYQRLWGIESTRKYLMEITQSKEDLNFAKFITPTFIDRLKSNRIYSTFVYPNIYACFLISMMPFLFFFFLKKEKKLKIISLFLFILCFINLILTESIGGILIFLFVFHLILLELIISEKIRKKVFLFLILVEFIFFLVGYHFKILPHIHSLVDRIYYWKSSIKIITLKPTIGIGSENFKFYFLKFKLPEAMEAKHAHNLLIEILIENGFIGLLFFLLFISKIIFFDTKNDLISIGIKYSLVAFLIHNMIDFDFYDPSTAVILFIFSSMIQKKQKEISVSLTKKVLYFIIFICIMLNYNLIKFEISERYRDLASREKDLMAKLHYYEKSVSLYRKNYETYFELGDFYLFLWMQEKDKKFLLESEKFYKQSLEINPYFTKGYRRLAFQYDTVGNYEKAEEMYLKLLDIYPNKKLYNLELALFYKKINKKDKFEYFYNKSKFLKSMSIEEGMLIEGIEKWIELQK